MLSDVFPPQVGDYVFAKIVIPEGFDFYVPAIVIALPNPNVGSEKLYTVLKCNNRRVSRLHLEGTPLSRRWLSPASASLLSGIT